MNQIRWQANVWIPSLNPISSPAGRTLSDTSTSRCPTLTSSSLTKLIFHSLTHPLTPPSTSHPCGPTLQSGCWWWFRQDCCSSVSSPTGSPLLAGHGPVRKRKCTEDWQVGKKKIHARQQAVQLHRLQHRTLCVISTPLAASKWTHRRV